MLCVVVVDPCFMFFFHFGDFWDYCFIVLHQLHLFYSMLVSNDTLEELASHLFQRACVSMDELKHVDDMLTLGEFYLCTVSPLFTSGLCFLLSLVSVY